MTKQHLTAAFTVDKTPEEAFAAINNVRAWWSGEIDGVTDELGAEWTYRYKDIHYSKQKIVELIPSKKVVWLVQDGTKITFEIAANGDKTEIKFTHVGLAPNDECFEACSDAWGSYIKGSLRSLIATGKGQPNVKES